MMQKQILLKADFKSQKEHARKIISERVEFYNSFYEFPFSSIRIKNQKTRWGSCSSDKNLNFNYKIVFLPDEQRDYIIVHEICHLKQLNHSPLFWQLVAHFFPHYKLIHKQLKNYKLRP